MISDMSVARQTALHCALITRADRKRRRVELVRQALHALLEDLHWSVALPH